MTIELQNLPEALDIQPEMEFRDAGSRHLHVVNEAASSKISDYFSHYIIRQPLDLLMHVQRINFAVSQSPEIDIYSALLDLYITLGSRGLSLRRAMLALASTKLDAVHLLYLSDVLEAGIDARAVINDPGISVLCSGYSGCVDMVEVQRQNREINEDPLQQAMDSIECSNLDEARVILEEAIYNNNSNMEQQSLLLEIYRKTDDKAHFKVLYETLDGDTKLVHAEWLALAEHFELSQ